MKKVKLFNLSIFILIFMLAFGSNASFAGGNDDFLSDMDGKLTLQIYNVSDLPWANQGDGWNTNVQVWQNRNVIFSDDRKDGATTFVCVNHSGDRRHPINTASDEVLFVKKVASRYYGSNSKTSKKAWGYYVPTKSGNYQFKVNSDDGATFYLFEEGVDVSSLSLSDAKIKADAFEINNNAYGVSNTEYLKIGKKYPVYIEYFNWGGDGFFELKERINNGNYRYVDKSKFYPSSKDEFFSSSSLENSLEKINSGTASSYDFNKIIKKVKDAGSLDEFMNSYKFNFGDLTYKRYTANIRDNTKIIDSDLYSLKNGVQSLKNKYNRDLTEEEIVKMIYKFYHAIAENHFYDENGNDIIPPINRAYTFAGGQNSYIYSYLKNEDYEINRVEVEYINYLDEKVKISNRYANYYYYFNTYSNVSLTMDEVKNGVKFFKFYDKNYYDNLEYGTLYGIVKNINPSTNIYLLKEKYNTSGMYGLIVDRGYSLKFNYYYTSKFLSAIGNFKAETKDSNDDKVILTWTKPSYDFDKYQVYMGDTEDSLKLINGNVSKDLNKLEISLEENDYSDKVFKIVAIKDDKVSNPSYANWTNDFNFKVIENFEATTASGNRIKLTWTKPSYDFDKYEIYIGNDKVDMIKALEATPETTDAYIVLSNSGVSQFDFTDKVLKIVAKKGNRVSEPVYAEWSNENKIIVNMYSGHTGKLLKSITKLYEGSQAIEIDLTYPNYKPENYDNSTKMFAFNGSKKVVNIMYIEDSSNPVVDKSTWKDEAIDFLDDYAKTGEIEWYKNSLYEDIYDNDDIEVIDALNTDFIRILATAGGQNIKEDLKKKYMIAFGNATKIESTADVQEIIDQVNDENTDAIEVNNEEENENGFVNNDDNKLETFYDFSLKDVLNFEIVKNGVYSPKFNFTLKGNEYLVFEYPKVEVYKVNADGSNGDKLNVESLIKFDNSSDEYMVEISPYGLSDDMLAIGKYRVVISSKIIVNTDKHSVREVLDLNSEYKDYELWKLPYVIGNITDENDNNIVEGIYLDSIIKYKKSKDAASYSETQAERVFITIESRQILDGSF